MLNTDRYLHICGNPERTRQLLLEKASILFNTHGHKATSLSDICKATKLTKGAIYQNFKDKSDLEKEALKFMCSKLLSDIGSQISIAQGAKKKLFCILEYFESYCKCPPFEGGCPLMNASIEVDDSNLELKKVVQKVMSMLHKNLGLVIRNGIKHRQFKKNTDVTGLASLIISSVEGALMLFKILDTDIHMKATVRYLKIEIQRNLL